MALLINKCTFEQKTLLTTVYNNSPNKISSSSDLDKLTQPTRAIIESIKSFRDEHQSSRYLHHLSAMEYAVLGLRWFGLKNMEVSEGEKSYEYHINKIQNLYRGKESVHLEWTLSLIHI
eukprot:TRINITY_DN10740_c0_g2_i1.p1 TRINITY_DN10740_c0_g2~~TRINITY_DN10740_c0_g2_i1.p1  ORF type:complete len:138 (+),score=11.13 TRINITY_DN10740_c0_g2_i1:60-416(+)